MLSNQAVELFLERYPAGLCDIVRELRNLVAAVTPDATEVARRNGLVYFDPRRGGPVSAGICQILLQPDHVRLAFIHGAFLPDPDSLLEGGRQYKKFVRIVSYEQAPWGALMDLIEASARFDPRSLAPKDSGGTSHQE